MPRPKAIKTIIIELVMYIGAFAIVGHLCESLFERFMVQSELSKMKSDLNTLGMSLNNIEVAYDTLCAEVQSLALTNNEDSKHHPYIKQATMKPIMPTYAAYIVHKPEHTNIQDLFNKRNADTEANIEKKTKNFMQNFEKSKTDFAQICTVPAKDKYTVTETHGKYDDSDDIDPQTEDFCRCVEKYIYRQSGPKNVTPQSNLLDKGRNGSEQHESEKYKKVKGKSYPV